MGHHKCLNCKRKVSITNAKNIKCKRCKQFYHQNCLRILPRYRMEQYGFRHKIVFNPNWVCDACILNELPFYNISDSQVRSMIPKFILPSCEVLNDKFLTVNQDDGENIDDFQFDFKKNETKYSNSMDLKKS